MIPIQFARQTGSGKAKAVNGAYLENWYVQNTPRGSKTPQIVVGTPGSYLLLTLPTGPALAGILMGGVAYVVTATKLYSITEFGYTEIGDVSLNGRASIATNGTYLVVVGGNGYYYSVAGGLNQFTGGAWNDCYSVFFLDGYFVFSAVVDSDLYFISGINDITLDASKQSYAESLPDAILASATLNGEIWHFGGSSTEIHYNSADPDFTFEKRQGILVERGIGAAETLCKDDTLFWLGEDRAFYVAEGYYHRRISTDEVEESIAIGTFSDAHSYIYTEEGHKFWVTTFPTLKITWAYDMTTGLWARRSHSQFEGRHHARCHFKAFGKNLIADFQNGNIYVMTLEWDTDNGDSIIRDAICPVIHNNREQVSMKRIEVKMNSGCGIAQGENPQAQLCFSDDGAETWSNWHYRDIGKIGKRLTRIIWDRMGQFRERHIWIRISSPIKKCVIDGIWGDFS